MTHVTGGGLSPLHQQHSLSRLFIILELLAFMGGGEDRLQSPGDEGCLSGRLAARATSGLCTAFQGVQPCCSQAHWALNRPEFLEIWNLSSVSQTLEAVSCKINLVNHSQYFFK